MVEKALRVYLLGWNWSKEQEVAEAYAKPCQTSKVERFAEMVNGSTMLTVFAKHSLLNVCQSSEYGFAIISSLVTILPFLGKKLSSFSF